MKFSEKMSLLQSLHLGPDSKPAIALVLCRARTAVDLNLYSDNTAPDEVISVLREIGLTVIKMEEDEYNLDNKNHVAKYCISLDPACAEILKHTIRVRESTPFAELDYSNNLVYLMLTGHPYTAAHAICTGATLSEDDAQYPTTMKGNLLAFAFSKEHWHEEINRVIESEKILRTHAPKILQDLEYCISQ